MDQHVTKMTALGRKFQLGDLYNYRTDNILTEYRCGSTNLPSGTQTETGFELKLMQPDSDITHKWQHMGLDGHLQASLLAGLFETDEMEADKLRGASHYSNDVSNPTEITQTFICRVINKKDRLDLPSFFKNNVATNGKLPDATHIVVGIAYGAEIYCVLAQNVKEDQDEDAREETAELLTGLSSKMQVALEENQNSAEFKEQFTEEEKKLVSQIQCRVYADLQTQSVRKCNLFDAYKLCLNVVDQVMTLTSEKAVPVVAVLCPLKFVLNASEKLEKNFEYRDVDAELVARCCRIWTELEQVTGRSKSIGLSFKKTSSRSNLRLFAQVLSKFQDLLKKSWKKSIVKAREREDEDDQEVEKVVRIAETHPLFNISSLNRWLHFKQAEMEIATKMCSIKGITFLASKTQLEKKLAFTFDKKFTLVLYIPPMDQRTEDLLCAMQKYVDKNTELAAGDSDSDKDVHPWHMVTGKRKQVLDNIREMVDHIEKNKYLENDVRFFIIPDEGGKKFGCSYSIYQADNLLKENLTQLPTSYDETCIGRSQFSEVNETESTQNMNRSIDVEKEERIILNQKEIVLHPPILVVSAVTQTTADLEWTPSILAAESDDFSHKIRYWRNNGQRMSVHVCVDSGENQFRLEDLQPGSTYSINIVATSEDGQESAPSETIEFTTHQLQEVSIPVCIAQNIFSTVSVDELKLLRELVTNLKKESDETKSALIEKGNHFEEKMKKSTECLTKRLHETEKTIVTLNQKLNGITFAVERRPLLQGEAKNKIEKKWFETMQSAYPNVKVLENLIKRGVDVNVEDMNGQNALHYVCRKNYMNENIVDLVRLLIENGVDVNAKDIHGQASLHILCEFNQNESLIDVVHLLVENGVDVGTKTSNGCTALHSLCLKYQNESLIDVVHLFVKNRLDVNAKDSNGQTALLNLCQNYKNENLIDILRLFVENGVDVKAKDDNGDNALHVLCYKFKNENLIDIVRLLVENGVDVNAKNTHGFTALHWLCQYYKNENAIDIIRLLVENGVDVNAKDINGYTALQSLCVYYKNENLIDIVRLLVENRVDVNAKWKNGCNALHWLCRCNKNENLIDIVRLFVENEVDVNAKTNNGYNALHWLCGYNKNENLIDIIRLFVENGVDMNAKDNNGKNALHVLCCNFKNENHSDHLIDIVRLFVENEVDVKAKDNYGCNALHWLCANYKNEKLIDIVRLFVENGVDVNAKDFNGDAPRDCILKYYNKANAKDILKLLGS